MFKLRTALLAAVIAYVQASAARAQVDQDSTFAEKPITSVDTNTRVPEGEMPQDFAAERAQREPPPSDPSDRGWMPLTYHWQATRFCHKPLYFEEVNLERYGYSFGVIQPWVSGTVFYANIALLPAKIIALPPRRCVYNLGYERPGDYVPFRRNWLP